mgnify:FL=1
MTIFDTPILSWILRSGCLLALRLLGWTLIGELPKSQRFVMIAEPHTAASDLPLMLSVAFAFKLKLHWIGKEELFRGWRRPVMSWLGGLPVKRSGELNEVDRIADLFEGRARIALAIAPGGTRAKTSQWRSGFYWIAVRADVPILLSFLDYKTRSTGVGPLFSPTGDHDADVTEMRKFYQDMEGKHPAKS